MACLVLLVFFVSCGVRIQDETLLLTTDDHVFSSWDYIRNRPDEGCYTRALHRAIVDVPPTGVAIMGLGGGILPARLAKRGARSHVVEWSGEVIATYRDVFEPMLSHWSPNVSTHVTVQHADALVETYDSFDVVVVDVPQCYRDVSPECVGALKRLRSAGKRLVVNVWYYNAERFASEMGGDEEGTWVDRSENGVLVWAT